MSSRAFGSRFWKYSGPFFKHSRAYRHKYNFSNKITLSTCRCILLVGASNTDSFTGFSFKDLLSPIIHNETLSPDSKGDTLEMGLYIASQRELEESKARDAELAIMQSKNILTRQLRRLVYYVTDLLEPLFVTIRFLELSIIFVPILITYPISFFGKRIYYGNDIVETQGSLVWYRLFRKALELAGPSFIKLGQWASSRTDIFPHGFCNEFSNLHSNSKPHPTKYSISKICETLNIEEDEFNTVFEEFQSKPLGIGAIAQVHLGKLSQDYFLKEHDSLGLDFYQLSSSWVAIKIIHPNARSKIRRDLKIMENFANAINALPTMEWLSLPDEVYNFSILMNLQLDLRIESLNLDKFNQNFKNSIQVKFPKSIKELSNKDVLFEEYMDAMPMDTFLKYKDLIKDIDLRKKVSDVFIDAFLQMLVLDNFVHADLHPGNVMIRFIKTNRYETKLESTESEISDIMRNLKSSMKNDDTDIFVKNLSNALQSYAAQICLIDTGLVTELNSLNRVNFIDLFNALARFNGYKAGELMIERSKSPETAINKEIFAFKVEKLVSKVKQRTFTLGTVSIGDLLDQMLGMVRAHHVRLEGDFVSVIVAILLLEGIGRRLDPHLDLFERFVSYSLIEGLI
ncbi:hypothetical protein TPHA_0I01610 [Tetrapisispora phaffii CBS 4417]|uniref:ABC1 atypical kinase-like domain-containing protein n=1 Tax=Tetrapisispora phaffii (strain ATCC 24235 / CBS 4417 / NBRC 1672 / NRRL Y-8282 / UCD 70-5) TaxID=1071381 RepID=G8BXN7_TETPH|nr:hypothetical protein TPHA_0I01610 [Tetrapisispora phaffii CBS 4417]CCE64665.1 hypothetical protein TPHA_0I01610 [Tetrapisispora phaffii CBS 4417]